VPEDCVGKTFENLFNYLLDLKKPLVTMALYRLKGSQKNEHPYVYTNPAHDTIITHRDKAFVLGIEIPNELRGDLYEILEKEGNLELQLSSKKSNNLNNAGRDNQSVTPSHGVSNQPFGGSKKGMKNLDQTTSMGLANTGGMQGGGNG